jgi:aromatic-L-amino-acid decarboxylase
MIEGIEHVDSLVLNPHKWMLTNFDCSAHFVRDEEALVRTLGILPAYLESREGDRVINYRDWGVPLGRRFRALKLWFVIRSYGVDALAAMIRDHIAWAGELAEAVAAAPGFELTSPARLALFTFRHHPAGMDDEAALDALNTRLLEAINDDGRIYLTQTRLDGRTVIRFSVGQANTQRHHVQAAWDVIREVAHSL